MIVGPVFATEFGTAVDPRNVLRTIEIAAQKAGISDIGVHTLRHSAAVAWMEIGRAHQRCRRSARPLNCVAIEAHSDAIEAVSDFSETAPGLQELWSG